MTIPKQLLRRKRIQTEISLKKEHERFDRYENTLTYDSLNKGRRPRKLPEIHLNKSSKHSSRKNEQLFVSELNP